MVLVCVRPHGMVDLCAGVRRRVESCFLVAEYHVESSLLAATFRRITTPPPPPYHVAAPLQLCASEMTEHLGGDLAFTASDGKPAGQPPVMLRPRVRVLSGGSAAVVSCERPRGAGLTGGGGDGDTMVQETRVWEMQGGRWRCVHCHTSPGVEGKPSR